MDVIPFPLFERRRPFGRLSPRRVFTLPLEQIHPIIHIAHHLDWAPETPERVLFHYYFILTYDRGGVLELGGERIEYAPRDLLFVPPFVPHAWRPHEQVGHHISVHFDWAPGVPGTGDPRERRPYEVQRAHGAALPTRVPLSAGHRLEQGFWNVVHGWSSGEPLGRLEAVTALSDMLAWLLRHAAPTPSHSAAELRNRARVERVIAHVRQHLSAPMDTSDLAAIAGVSRSRLPPLFKQITGYAPLEYVRRMRIDEAKRLLADVDLSIKEIAARTGFSDVYHFSHAFHRLGGMSPSPLPADPALRAARLKAAGVRVRRIDKRLNAGASTRAPCM